MDEKELQNKINEIDKRLNDLEQEELSDDNFKNSEWEKQYKEFEQTCETISLMSDNNENRKEIDKLFETDENDRFLRLIIPKGITSVYGIPNEEMNLINKKRSELNLDEIIVLKRYASQLYQPDGINKTKCPVDDMSSDNDKNNMIKLAIEKLKSIPNDSEFTINQIVNNFDEIDDFNDQFDVYNKIIEESEKQGMHFEPTMTGVTGLPWNNSFLKK